MIYPYTIILHGVMAGLCLFSAGYLLNRNDPSGDSAISFYRNWFLIYFFFNVSLVFPLIFSDDLGWNVAIGYGVALFFLAIAAWQAFKLPLRFFAKDPLKFKLVSGLFILGVLVAAFLNFIFLELPQGTPDGKWVLWSSNIYVISFFNFFMFVAGWSFALLFLTGIRLARHWVQKWRSIFLSLGAFVLPIAAFYYFGAKSFTDVYLAFIFAISGLMFFAIGNIIPSIFVKAVHGK